MKNILLALFSGVLLTVASPPVDASPLAWIAFVPFFLALENASAGTAFVLGTVQGTSFIAGACRWINVIEGVNPGYFAFMALSFGVFVGFFALLLATAGRRARIPHAMAAPTLWVAMEYVRLNAGFLGHPWGLVAHSQYHVLPLIQVSSVTGAYGVSFLVLFGNSGLYGAWRACRPGAVGESRAGGILLSLAPLAAVIGAAMVFGYGVLRESPETRSFSVAVVQGNIPQDVRWDPAFRRSNLDRHIALTEAAARERPVSLVVWPETSAPGLLTSDLWMVGVLAGTARATGAALLVGTAHGAKLGPRDFRQGKSFNTALLFSPQGVIAGRYDKLKLLPFGEYLPWGRFFPWPERLAKSAGNFQPGRDYVLPKVGDVPVGVPICWETFFPDHFRRFVDRGAILMANITNEAWFGDTGAPYQFLAMTVFRAVENRVPIARAANTGVSCFIDTRGRILGRVNRSGKDLFVEGFLIRNLTLRNERTFYTRHGDVFAWLCAGGALLMVCDAALAGWRRPRLPGRGAA